eukprot:gene17108-20335_t
MTNLRLAQYDTRGYQHSSFMKLLKACFTMRRTDAEVVALYEGQMKPQRPDQRFSNVKPENLPSPRKPLMGGSTTDFYDLEAAEVEATTESSAVPAHIRNAHMHAMDGGLSMEDVDLNLDNLHFGGDSGGQGGHPFWGQLGELCEQLDQESQ